MYLENTQPIKRTDLPISWKEQRALLKVD